MRTRISLPMAGWAGLSVLAISVGYAQTPKADISKDFNRSPFSTASILADLTNGSEHDSATGVAPLTGAGTLVSSQPGAFQYNPETQQSTSTRKVVEEIRATQELENRQNAELAAHPFWHAPFWKHSPVALLGIIAGGVDLHPLETPPTEFEKLTAPTSPLGTNYNNEAELKKFEHSVSFGNVNSSGNR
jgi:hypothetical protein